jgi:hypothetical protein
MVELNPAALSNFRPCKPGRSYYPLARAEGGPLSKLSWAQKCGTRTKVRDNPARPAVVNFIDFVCKININLDTNQ